MTTLISGLIDLARGEQQTAEPEEVRLDLVAADAVERARRDRPAVTFTTDLQESMVQGVPATIERAVANLLDNAAKWSPPEATSRWRCETARSASATMAPESTRKIFLMSSIASIALDPHAAVRARVSASHRPPGCGCARR